MEKILSGLQGVEIFVCMDDILVDAPTLNQHTINMKNAGLTLHPEKCLFLRKAIAYLGHIILEMMVQPNPGKMRANSEFPQPKNRKNIKQFLGLAGYYKKFIFNLSKIAKPLCLLLKKDPIYFGGWGVLKQSLA